MSHDTFILALDQGTTSSRAILFNHSGKLVGTAQQAFKQHYPQPGWVEHDPMEIWETQRGTAAKVLEDEGLSSDSIAAVGITNQRETTVLWDKQTGEPVYNAIVWQDRRTSDYCRKLKQDGVEPMVTDKTGLRLDPYFAGTKLRWILKNVDGVRTRAEKGELLFGTIDTWITWHLSGRQLHVTDVSNAARTLLYNVNAHEWDDELLELFSIPREVLPEVRASSEVVGKVGEGLPMAGVPIAGMAGDQHAALFGQTCFEPGMAKSTYGTGSFLLMNMGTERVTSENNLLSTVAWKIGDRVDYALEGSVFIAGAAVQWVRDELQLVKDVKELDELASSVDDAGGMYLVPAFAGLGAPHWDPYARGAAFGMTRGTNRAHFCRAAIESIAFQTADLITAMKKDSGLDLKELRVDGGAANSTPMLQFQADLLQSDVVRPTCIETTALGVAYLAGLAVGYWKSQDDIQKHWQQDVSFSPQRDAEEMQTLRKGWDKAVERSRDWIEPEDGAES